MPELPEVETTRRGIAPHVVGNVVREVVLHRLDLRLPVPLALREIEGCKVLDVRRRAKYLLLDVEGGQYVIIHLGMSGSLRVVAVDEPFRKHDHVAFTLSSGRQLRFHDPRRFGIVTHGVGPEPLGHQLFRKLGPEPLEDGFDATVLFASLRGVKRPIKVAIMDNAVVVGVGNIYASESLFQAGILPTVAACDVSRAKVAKLVAAIKDVLQRSIEQGGTTLRDFLRENGEPGYFRQELYVYERGGQPCRVCGTTVEKLVLAQRSSYFCRKCQR